MKQFNLDYLPDNPQSYYRERGWKGYRDFYGNEYISFDEAKNFVRDLNLKNREEWRGYCKSGEKPKNIPAAPNMIYNDEWKGFNDWLSVDNLNIGGAITRKIKLTFKDAKKYVHGLNLKTTKDWREWVKGDTRPLEIPSDPPNAYLKEWISWNDWLNTEHPQPSYKDREITSFEEMRDYATKSNISTSVEWKDLFDKELLPNGFLKHPYYFYKKQWEGWGNFLGVENNYSKKEMLISFSDADKFVKNLNLKSYKEWIEYKDSIDFPSFLPKDPSDSYKKDWKSWGDFLGTNYIACQNRKYFSYKDAQNYVKGLGITSSTHWVRYWKANKIPTKLPIGAPSTYKDEWVKNGGWGGFLGTGTVATIERKYLSLTKLTKLVQKNKIKTQREYYKWRKNSKRIDIPYHPQITWKKDWINWYDFLGK